MKCLFGVATFFLLSSVLLSQQFYIKLQGGYGLGHGGNGFTSTTQTQLDADNYSLSEAKVNSSFGKGLQIGGTFGYLINSNIGAELEIQYSRSSAITFDRNYISADLSQTGTVERTGVIFSFNPSVLLLTDIGNFKPYLKVGAIIAFPEIEEKTNAIIKQVVDNQNRTANQQIEYTYSGGMAFGFNSAIGTQIGILQNIAVNIEISNKNLFYSPTKGKMETFLYDGINRLEQIPTYNKQIEFVENRSYNTTKIDYNKPQQQLKENYSFSSIGILVGVVFRF